MKKLDIIEANTPILSDNGDFETAIAWIQEQGGKVNRLPQEELKNSDLIQTTAPLPVVFLNREIVLSGCYPTLEQMKYWLEITAEEESAPCCGCCGG